MSANAEIIAELRRVLNERDEAREQLDLTKRELGRWVDREAKAVRERDEARAACPDCAMWAERSARWHDDMQRAERERDEAQWHAEGLRAALVLVESERDEARADAERYLADLRRCASEPYEHAKERAEAFRRGAEAMRKRCAMWIKHNSHEDGLGMGSQRIESALAALPIPEEP